MAGASRTAATGIGSLGEMVDNPILVAFNRGIISDLGLARVDLNRTRLSAEEQTNWMPRVLGSMMLRPGWQYIGATRTNSVARFLPFVFASDDVALVEVTDSKVRVWVDDALVTRPSVSSAVSNGTFDSDLTGWTDSDEAGATSAWVTGGYMGLTGNGSSAAIRDQEVTVAGGDQNTRHALRIIVERGPVTLRVGSTSGDDDYMEETTLRTGEFSLAFTPTGNFHIRLMSRLKRQVLVDSVAVEASGTMEITAPWAESHLSLLRVDQSGDVLFVACKGCQQRRIERRASDSWGVAVYTSEAGPYRIENTGPTTLAASAISGNITLTASNSLFKSGHVGALFRHISSGQRVEASIAAENTFTSDIRVTGTGASRQFTIERSGTWSATATLQRSIGETGDWEDVAGQTYTTNGTTTYNDGLDNQIVFYRFGVKTGAYTSGTLEAALDYPLGSITGVARITSVTNATTAAAEVITDLGGTDPTDEWAEGDWSTYRGWPSAVALHDGRLWWSGKGKIWGSVSDAFESFDPDTEGDSGPINRSIGSGPVDTIHWLLPLLRMIMGTDGREISVRSTSLDEPITPSNFNLRTGSSQGSAAVSAVKADEQGYFTQASGIRVYETDLSPETLNYTSGDLTALVPEIGEPSITAMAIQRQPDTRLHCVRSDGKVAVLVRDRAEEVRCWILVETDGAVEDVAVLPGTTEDAVYYVVKRTINGATTRYLEKWALESEVEGGTLNKQADSFATFTNAPAAASIPAGTCSHLVAESVVVWADGKCLRDSNGDIATFTVDGDGGVAALTNNGSSYSATTGVVGLAYRARYKSSKLAYAAEIGTGIGQRGRVARVGLVLANTHPKGLKYGQSYDEMDEMPEVEDGAAVDADTIWTSYDKDSFSFPGEWSPDPRICLEANAPRPANVLAIPVVMERHLSL